MVIFKKVASLKNMYIISRQLSVMTSAGINVINIFHILKSQKHNKSMKKALTSVANGIGQGKSLYESLKNEKYFPKTFTEMIFIGESSGNLEKVFSKLTKYYHKEYTTHQIIKGALAYPIFILIVSFIASIIISTTILPMICSMIEELGISSIPLPTKILIAINNTINGGELIGIITSLVILLIVILLFSKLIKRKLNIKIYNIIYKNIIAARFSRSLGMLINSGIPIDKSLEMCENLLGEKYKHIIQKIRVSVVEGGSLFESIKKSKVFPEIFSNMVETGEESGKLDLVLDKMEEYYEGEIEFNVKRFTKVFEPTLIIVLSLGVGFLLASVMLPLFQIYGEI